MVAFAIKNAVIVVYIIPVSGSSERWRKKSVQILFSSENAVEEHNLGNQIPFWG